MFWENNLYPQVVTQDVFEEEGSDENSWRTDVCRGNWSDLSNTDPNIFPQKSGTLQLLPICDFKCNFVI